MISLIVKRNIFRDCIWNRYLYKSMRFLPLIFLFPIFSEPSFLFIILSASLTTFPPRFLLKSRWSLIILSNFNNNIRSRRLRNLVRYLFNWNRRFLNNDFLWSFLNIFNDSISSSKTHTRQSLPFPNCQNKYSEGSK